MLDSAGIVHMDGLVSGGSGVICVLPVGYRPSNTVMFASETYSNNNARIDVRPDGSVYVDSGSSVWISLANIHFGASQFDDRWAAATYEGSWTNYGSGWSPARYMLDSAGIVHMDGLVSGGSGVICVLPVGYRPANQVLFATLTSGNNNARIDMRSDGSVYMDSGSSAWLSLHTVVFSVQ
jgi:hypothetical protein